MKQFITGLLVYFYLANVLACSMGVNVDFIHGVPEGYTLVQDDKDYVNKLVEDRLGQRDWVQSTQNFTISAPEIAENPSLIPITISLDRTKKHPTYREIIVLVERQVSVLSTRDKPVVIPHRNHQLPINWAPETINASAPGWVATYNLGTSIHSVSMRLNMYGASKIRLIGLLVPEDDSLPVQVLRQAQSIGIHTCDYVIYVDGPMPEDADRSFYYF